MAPPTPSAVDMIPRHLQSSGASASSSSNASPAGTPPAPSSVNASQPSFARSPSTSALPLPSPGATTPGSPGGTGGNRFGLALGGFIQRRPRGWTTSSAQRSPATSPAAELPPSPSAGERTGYGFPALRRSLSKRTSSTGDQSRTRQSRSSSQPPAPVGLVPGGEASTSSAGSAATAAAEGRAALAASTSGGGGASQAVAQAAPPSPNPQFSSLTATTSLPNPPPNRPRATTTASGDGGGDTSGEQPAVQKLRLVPHLESSRSLHFDPIERDLAPFAIVRVGRFTDRSQQHGGASGGATSANAQRGTATEPARVAFKSKVVSRGHAEVWVDDAGKFFIRDTKSSSGTFLNHIRLSSPNVESRPFALKDGDVLQLGVDYQGGTEEIYRCVKMRVELNRGWQRGANSFNTAALAQLRALGATPDAGTPASASSASLATPNAATAAASTSASSTGGTAKPSTPTPHASTSTSSAAADAAAAASITDCCICLYPVTVCQALFIAPCSHVTHFKCIRPLVEQNYPGFSCPLCRTYANLEADVEIDLPEPEPAPAHVEPSPSVSDAMLVDEPDENDPLSSSSSSSTGGALGLGLAGRSPPMAAVEEADEPASRAASIRSGATGRAAHGAGSRRSSMQGLSQALAEGAARARSRPASIAPGAAGDNEEDEEMLEWEQEHQVGDEARAHDDGDCRERADDDDDDDEPASSFASRRIASSPTHLAPPIPEDLYASLASAATPPNNTFLSTLADSGAVFLPTVGPLQQGSIDAAVMAVRPGPGAGAGAGSSSARGSGSGASGGSTDGEIELEGEGEGEDAQQPGSATSPQRAQGKGKAKARDEPAAVAAASSPPSSVGQQPAKQRKRRSSLFEGMTGSDHPDPSVAAALLM
ncbi:hypothetical protein JCM8208_006569 [Rhodotorula glutinis]